MTLFLYTILSTFILFTGLRFIPPKPVLPFFSFYIFYCFIKL